MSLFFITILLILWLVGATVLMISSITVWTDGNWPGGLGLAILAILLFAAPTLFIPSTTDPNANRLCLSGSQKWVTTYRPATMVGKIWIPGGPETHKVWVCSQWE